MNDNNNTIQVPFSTQQVEDLNTFQKNGRFHPFTCCSAYPAEDGCERSAHTGEGLLVATEGGWVCPCGKYTQNWAHEFMAKPLGPDPFEYLKLKQ